MKITGIIVIVFIVFLLHDSCYGFRRLTNSSAPQSTTIQTSQNTIDRSANTVDLASSKEYYKFAAHCMSEELLTKNGYPRPGAMPGSAVMNKKPDSQRKSKSRYCRRCDKRFILNEYRDDNHRTNHCQYHPRVPGVQRARGNTLPCCRQPADSPGCMTAKHHVADCFDPKDLIDFVKTDVRDKYVPTNKDIYALDCKTIYTSKGLELARVTVVDINGKTVYDELVKPDNKIIDYNTKDSGITEKTLKEVTRKLRDVQKELLSRFNSKTILIGHSLEYNLKFLKLIHGKVVDTSILYLPNTGMKQALKTLCYKNLKRTIQENDGAQSSSEDAVACMDLVKHYINI